jgi:hypothetical protein
MAFVIRNLLAEEPGGGARYLGIIQGTGTYHNVEKTEADRFATREEADAALPWLGRMYGAANLAVEDENYDPAEAQRVFNELLISGIKKCEIILPRSAEILGVDPITEAEMSVLRVVMSQVTSALTLKALVCACDRQSSSAGVHTSMGRRPAYPFGRCCMELRLCCYSGRHRDRSLPACVLSTVGGYLHFSPP